MFDIDQNPELLEMKRALIAQETNMRELFEMLGITPEELHSFLEDKSRFTAAAWEKMEQERQRVEALIESEHLEITALRKKKIRSTPPPHIKNHWIPMR